MKPELKKPALWPVPALKAPTFAPSPLLESVWNQPMFSPPMPEFEKPEL
jgi:hypothetical protein